MATSHPQPFFAILGGITGLRHVNFNYLFGPNGRSLHPLQRDGSAPVTGLPNLGAGHWPGLGDAPAAAPSALGLPPVIQVGMLTPGSPSARV